MNMGTPGHPESVEHFGTKAAMLSLFRTAIPRGAVWGMVREPQHGGCSGGPTVVNLTAGIKGVYVEEPDELGGFIPDITLLKPAPHPSMFIEVEVTSPASARKVNYCRQHGIDLFTASGRAPVDNNAKVRLLHLEVETMRCRRKERDRMNDLWSHLHSVPDDDDCRFGAHQATDRTVKYIIGRKSVSREDLCTMCVLHAYFIQDMEARFGDATSGEHGAPMHYSPQAIAAQDAIMAVVNRVDYQNGPDGPRCPPEQAHVRELSDVFFYPHKWGLAPSPDAYRRA
jgi:hypothetical protein